MTFTSIGLATVLGFTGLFMAAPASAATRPIGPGVLSPWSVDTFDCDVDTSLATTQTFVTGPATPPAGAGSLQFDLSTKDGNFTEYFRTNEYDRTKLADIATLGYSTYVKNVGDVADQPPYFRLSVDKDNNGTRDSFLYFFPVYNSPIVQDTWQTWDVRNGQFKLDGDNDPAFTLDSFVATNPNAVLLHVADAPAITGAITIGHGCGGAGTAGSIANLDKIVVKLATDPQDTFDLEPASSVPARTLTLSPTSGIPGTEITVSGAGCKSATTADVFLVASNENSGGIVTEKDGIAVAADGTFTTKVTIPNDAKDTDNYGVSASCGSSGDPSFVYPQTPFDVTPATPPTDPNKPTGGNGYRMVAADGGIFTFGARVFHGSTGDLKLNKPIVGGATDKGTYDGYWIVASDGGVFTFNAPFFGSLGDQKLTAPATEIEPTPSGKGYWIVTADGKVFTFGDANHFGDMNGKPLNKPIIGMSVTPTGKGYWLVAEDGGIFNFGDAGFFGSTGNLKLNAPVIDLAPAVDNNGYYLLAKDGGVFTFGSADFKGSTGDMKLNAPVIAMLVSPTGAGYWLAATDGGIFTFGGLDFLGSMGGTKLNSPVLDLIN